jgi:uncharacterized coiled-coil protein SlyX
MSKMARDRDDGETYAILYDGASISQLKVLFSMDARDVARKLMGVPPTGERRGFPIWHVRDAAAKLVKPDFTDVEIMRYIAGMDFKHLPPTLNKEMWNGLRARLRFEVEQGDYWHVERIQRMLNEMMQVDRTSALLLADRVNREETLTTKQRDVIMKLSDEHLAEKRRLYDKAMNELDNLTPGIVDYEEGNESGQDEDSEVEEEADEF